MNFLYLHLQAVDVDIFIPGLILIGFGVGVISAFLGIGGAWLVTPALNIMGFPMAYAVGTDIAHTGAKGCLATIYHSKRKNVDYPLAFFMLIGTIVGVELGAQSVMFLESIDNTEPVLRWVYIVLLTIISGMIFWERKSKNLGWSSTLQVVLPPPYFFFKTSNIRSSVWLPILIGLFSGYLAGFLGIGGGLLRLPLLIYCMGCPVLTAVGTDLFEVMISGFYGGISYAIKGRVDYLAAIYMFMGAVLGTRIGVLAACRVQGEKIKNRLGFAVLGCLISIVLKQLNYPMFSKFAIFSTLLSLVLSILFIKSKKTVFWFTGLPCSGKTTIAEKVCKTYPGFIHLDGDEIRRTKHLDLGYSEKDREENLRRIADLVAASPAKKVLVTTITPLESLRAMVRERLEKKGIEFVLVYVDTPLTVCKQRDVKGMYAKALRGELHDFTGVSAPFEVPANPDLVIRTDSESIPHQLFGSYSGRSK